MKRSLITISVCILLLLPGLVAVGSEGDGAEVSPGVALAITLTPYNPPIVLPPAGGTFGYAVEANNDTVRAFRFDVWTEYTLPDGSPYGPVLGPLRFRVPGGWSTSRDDLSQDVPGAMPSGTYTYSAYLGRYPDLIVASDSFTFEKLPGGGWYPQTTGASYILEAVDFADAETGWAVGGTWEILHTTDGGDTWVPQNYQQPYPHYFYDLSFPDTQSGWAVGGIILHTPDGGETWVEQDSDYGYAFNGVFFVDANTGWGVGGFVDEFGGNERRVIEHTSDGGNTWSGQLLQFSYFPLNAVHFADANHGWAVGSLGAILYTANGGASWTEQISGTTADLSAVHAVDAQRAWCVGEDGTLLHTTDGGDTWLAQDPGTMADFASVFFADAAAGWVAGVDWAAQASVIYHTADGGETWMEQDLGPTASEFFLNDITFVDANQGWAAGGAINPFEGIMLHTESGGQ